MVGIHQFLLYNIAYRIVGRRDSESTSVYCRDDYFLCPYFSRMCICATRVFDESLRTFFFFGLGYGRLYHYRALPLGIDVCLAGLGRCAKPVFLGNCQCVREYYVCIPPISV